LYSKLGLDQIAISPYIRDEYLIQKNIIIIKIIIIKDKGITELRYLYTSKSNIHYAVTEESEKKYGNSTKKRARDISTAIFDDKEVIDALSRASNNLRDHQILNMAKVFQTEFSELRAEPGLGEFNAEIEPQNLNISGLARRSKELAPGLWQFLQDVTKSSSANDDQRREVSMVIYL